VRSVSVLTGDLVDFLFVFSVGHSHISPFLFTRTLLPLMEKAALEPGSDVRIVNVRTTLGSIIAALMDKTGIFCLTPLGAKPALR
jgi:hypothetical protein